MLKILHKIKDYLLIKKSGLFDEEYYLLNNPDVRQADVDPLWHFVSCGWKEGRNPSTDFDCNYYLSIYSDVYTSGTNPFIHFIKFGRREGRNPNIQNQTQYSVQEDKNLISEQTKIIEPSGNERDLALQRVKPKQIREIRVKKFLNFLDKNKVTKPIDYIYAIPLFSTGGGELVAINFIRLLEEHYPDDLVLLLITDTDIYTNYHSLPKNVILVRLESDLDIFNWDEKVEFATDLVVMLKPKLLHIINSSVYWSALLQSGEVIKKHTKVFANIFCVQYNDNRERTGYASLFLKGSLPFLDGLISDNKSFFQDIIDELPSHFIANNCFTIYSPCNDFSSKNTILSETEFLESIKRYQENFSGQPKFLWAGRLDKEKKFDLLIEIAKINKKYLFYYYGQSVVDESQKVFASDSNLYYRGTFKSFKEILDTEYYHGFIFTSRWEGLPTTLINVGNMGIPIIAPDVGGVKEIITSENGYLLPREASQDDYSQALKTILADENGAINKMFNLRQTILKQHTWESFSRSVSSIPNYLK